MSKSNMEVNLYENILLGAFTPMHEEGMDGNMASGAGHHPDGNGNLPPEKAAEMQKLYFNIMAHELNNFLHCIQSGIDMAKMELQADNNGEADTLLDDCARASYNSTCLLENYSMFLKGGSVHLKNNKIDVVEIARASAKMLLRDHRINFYLETDNIAKYVSGDETQLCQLFHNLLKNAKEAMTGNGITIKIDMSRASIGMNNPDKLMPGEYLRIKISDNGVGIDKNNIEHLFDPYFTLKKTGTGLGLCVCLWIARSHKGSIGVDSESGKGTVFTVLLPQSKFD
ncbi:MAG TPA: hypothetical protein DET40_06905 [Lentisphaeria bacterium]|nr:MAG: hypothetical protein A2X45_07395 [Lentisphaerae bacterium GWF2_50_93]HCE43259.1 hypothetical protein [Lentisphaeria bacterium]